MGKRLEAIGRGLKAAKTYMQSRKYSVANKPVRCTHCSGETFEQGSALLNTSGMTFLHLDWANKSATTLVCTECGKLEWFLKTPEKRV